ncbi:phage tail terminator protein [Inquilinus limosus]|uniref:Uncharacterized protein n=1 Tax=Inquilinus limosus MP06 TaxID=1398085 RepID=A0A0A0DC76_9PROT|nr:hypothetical protein [Inquilinus limosus]KGM35714.1 hypothetical protein P409_02710 [Inquilinus limosus MP06]
MTVVDQVMARLAETIPSLAGRIGRAGELEALIKAGSLPQGGTAAFVVPLGFRAGPPTSATGLHSQELVRRLAIILVVEFAGDATGEASIPEVDQLEDLVLRAVAGWKAPGAWGPFAAERGALLGLNAGTAFYQVDFSMSQLLRVTP